MYYLGIMPKFKVSRPLLEDEKSNRLPVDKALELEPTSGLSVTRMNSTYLELADKFYPYKGTAAAFGLTVFFLGFFSIIAFSYTAFWDKLDRTLSSEPMELFALLVLFVMMLFILVMGIWLAKIDCFRFTHYPIRLNRKTRTVYVLRLDGTVLEAPWDDLYITIEPAALSRQIVDGWDLRAHVMADDGETVLETFAFGYISDPDNLKHYFEYLRLYMDEGPEAIAPYTLDCLDIVDKKETAWFGFKRFCLNWGYLFFVIIMFPLIVIVAIARAFAMATCKIPRWPIEVEAACPIEKGDPWVRDASTHPAK